VIRHFVMLAAVAALGCRAARVEPLPLFDRSQLVDHAETLAVHVGTWPTGYTVHQVRVDNDSILSTITAFYHDSTTQQVALTFDIHSLKPRRVRAANSLEMVDLVYSANRVEGTRVVWSPAGKQDTLAVDVPLDSATLDRRNLLAIVPWLPLAVGHIFMVSVFDSWTGRVRSVRIAVEKEARLTVPAGTFRAYRIRLTTPPIEFMDDQGIFPAIVFVSIGSPRAILRIERPQQDAISVLTSHRP